MLFFHLFHNFQTECLDDFDWYGKDPLFFKLTNSPSSETMGKFLRSFHPRKIEEIRGKLPMLALRIRLALEPNCHKIIFKMDSSDHQQYGIKSEVVAYGYKNFLSLNPQNLFDDKGLCYGFKLHSGNTHACVDGTELIYETFSKIPKDIKKYFVADSAYSTMEIYNSRSSRLAGMAILQKQKGHQVKILMAVFLILNFPLEFFRPMVRPTTYWWRCRGLCK